MDPCNLALVPMLLQSIAPCLHTLMLISHQPINTEHRLSIQTINQCSYVNNTIIVPMASVAPSTEGAKRADDKQPMPQPNIQPTGMQPMIRGMSNVQPPAAPPSAQGADATPSVTCECGAKVKKSSLAAHRKTPKHNTAMMSIASANTSAK